MALISGDSLLKHARIDDNIPAPQTLTPPPTEPANAKYKILYGADGALLRKIFSFLPLTIRNSGIEPFALVSNHWKTHLYSTIENELPWFEIERFLWTPSLHQIKHRKAEEKGQMAYAHVTDLPPSYRCASLITPCEYYLPSFFPHLKSFSFRFLPDYLPNFNLNEFIQARPSLQAIHDIRSSMELEAIDKYCVGLQEVTITSQRGVNLKCLDRSAPQLKTIDLNPFWEDTDAERAIVKKFAESCCQLENLTLGSCPPFVLEAFVSSRGSQLKALSFNCSGLRES